MDSFFVLFVFTYWPFYWLLLIPTFFFCRSYELLLSAIDPKYGRMPPALAYVLLVPLLSQFWWLVLLFNVKKSLKKMQRENKLLEKTSGGFYLGLPSAILTLLPQIIPTVWVKEHFPWVVAYDHDIFFLFCFLIFISFILWIMCWALVADARRMIVPEETIVKS